MDEILGDTPTNSSPHSIDVFKFGDVSQVENGSQVQNASQVQNGSQVEFELDDTNLLHRPIILEEEEKREKREKQKRKNPTMEYVNIKKRYLEDKLKENADKKEEMHNYFSQIIETKKKEMNC